MMKLIRILFTGLLISFLGSLPLGTLNVAIMQISISDGLMPAIWFGLGSLTSEVVYVRLSLIAMDWVRKQKKIFSYLEWITLAIVVALAISSFYAALHPSVKKNVILSSTLHRYWLGLFMSALNPVQIPFWFGWSTVLFTKGILQPHATQYNWYTLGIGTGTLLGNFVFVFGGLLLSQKLNGNQNVLNWIIGGIFLVTAIIQAIKMMRHKDVEHRIDHPEEEQHDFESVLLPEERKEQNK
ncbi:LysE family translocator [Cnuella takakiae]|nr:LysE family transporter [Cnuella takakiae]OLY94846.1 lysine transporter LysE [Cnuella takakiae]